MSNIPEFQMYGQALEMISAKKMNGSPFMDPSIIINTINSMSSTMDELSYNYHCYNILRLLAVNILTKENTLSALGRSFRQRPEGTAILSNNMNQEQYELLSVYIEYYT